MRFAFKEVIQPQVPLGLPCYDFTPVMKHTVVTALPKVKLATSGAIHSHGVTGGVYKARERDRLYEICSASRLRRPLYRPL